MVSRVRIPVSPFMTLRSALIATVALVLAITLPAAAAQAAATQIGTASDPYELAIDGGALDRDNNDAVTKVDVATGMSTVVFRAPRGLRVYDVEAAGGTLSILVRKNIKGKSTTKVYVRSAATGKLRVAAQGVSRYKDGTDLRHRSPARQSRR